MAKKICLFLIVLLIPFNIAAKILSWNQKIITDNQEFVTDEFIDDRITDVNTPLHLSYSSYFKNANDDGGGDNLNYVADNNHHGSWIENDNFILTDYLADGEFERRISYNGITAKETSIRHNSSDILSLWQVSDGKKFIQLIYSNSKDLIDCEYVRQKGLVQKFLHDFYTEVDIAKLRNSTLSNEGDYEEEEEKENQDHHKKRNTKMVISSPVLEDSENAFSIKNLHYEKIERYEDIPEEIKQWLNYDELKLQCFRRHEQMKAIMKGLKSDDENVRRDANQSIQRRKRDLSDWLIAPNTKWCGKGHNAGKYNQLGGASRADKCCRKHDHCKLNIPGLTSKWHVFNYFPFTISHCSCDMRFRTCLKMADSSDASMVGKLFFNIVQTKCFVLKTEKVCKKHSWWGKCEKRARRKRAHLRDNRKF